MLFTLRLIAYFINLFMRKIFLYFLTNSLVFCLLAVDSRSSNEALPLYKEHQILVKFTDAGVRDFLGADCPLKRLEEQYGITILKSFGTNPGKNQSSALKLLVHPTLSTQALIELLKSDPAIEYAEPNYYRRIRSQPNDPHFSKSWGLENNGDLIDDYWTATAGCDIKYLPAQTYIRPGPVNVIIVVGDSGVQTNHPDLVNQIWKNPDETPGNGIDDDNNGYIDDVRGYNFGSNNNDTNDQNGHGTHVAGIIAAEASNGIGITGAFSNAKILPIAIGDENGAITTEAIISSINYVIELKNKGHNIVVYNFSFGGYEFSETEKRAFEDLNTAGIIAVAATGNEARNNDYDFFKSYPDCYDVPNIIAVGASDAHHGLYNQTNYGSKHVDLAAPGNAIYSTHISIEQYVFLNGTSQAAPFVSAAVAIAAHNFPNDTVAERVQRILGNTTPSATWTGKSVTGGILNLQNIVNSDNDDLPDWWEEDNFSGLSFDGEGDSDGDGFNEIQEYLSGTNPNSANSRFKPLSYRINPQNVMSLQIQTLAGRSYQLQVNSGLNSANWQNLGTPIIGDGTTKSFSDTLNLEVNPNRFYRVRVLSQ